MAKINRNTVFTVQAHIETILSAMGKSYEDVRNHGQRMAVMWSLWNRQYMCIAYGDSNPNAFIK